MSRRLIEVSVPSGLTPKEADRLITEALTAKGILVRSIQSGTVQQVVDEAHAIRDYIEGVA